MLAFAIVCIVGYLLGAISFAVIIARSRGVDIFAEGSGNPGATNVKRVLGRKLGNIVFALDAAKGLVAAGWPLIAYAGDVRLGIAGLVSAILGHSFSVFLKFRGGKGVATTIGGLAALMWPVLLVGLLVWLVAFYMTKVVAIASILFAVSLPFATAVLYSAGDLRFYLTLLLSLLIVYRHRSNVQRLLQKKENRF